MQNAIKWKLTEWGKQERLNKFQQTHLIWTLTGEDYFPSSCSYWQHTHHFLKAPVLTASFLVSDRPHSSRTGACPSPHAHYRPSPSPSHALWAPLKGHSSWRPSRLPYSKLVPSSPPYHITTNSPFLFSRLTMPCFLFIAVCPWAVWRNSLWISCSVPRAVPGMQRTHTCKSCKGSELND